MEEVHGLRFHGLGRAPQANPDDPNAFEPGCWWAQQFYSETGNDHLANRLLVPMDSRTTASPTGNDEYVFYRQGGWSWSIPYIAGMYALAAQVEPDITPDRFRALALKTSQAIQLRNEDKTRGLGPVLNPERLIAALKDETRDSQTTASLGR